MLFGKHINKYYIKYGLYYLIGVIALVAVDYVQLFVPKFLQSIVQILDGHTLTSNDYSIIYRICWEVVAVSAVMFIGRIIWRITIFNASSKIENSIRHEMFLKAERLSPSYYHDNNVGTVLAWFTNDLENIEECFGWGTIMLVDAFFLSVLTIIDMVKLSLALSIISFIPILFIIVWGALVEKFMSERWELRQKANDKLYDYAQENFTGIRVIKAFVKERQEIRAFAKVAKENKDVNIKFVRISVLFDVCIEIVISAIVCLLLAAGGYFVYDYVSGANQANFFNLDTSITADELVAFVAYFDILIWPMIALGQIVSMRSRASASLKRITNFLDQEEDIINPIDPIILKDVKGDITFNNFSFAYPKNDYDSLKNISLEIKQGERVGIVGKIGCGKTTLVNSLLRLYNVKENSIFIDGNDMMKCDFRSLRKAISYVPQDNFLFSDSIINNINFSNESFGLDEAIKGAKFSDVDKDIKDFKDGYETISGERGVTLSGGQKQRISIARAFIKDAPIMILDDSVSAVDVKTEETILHNIMVEREGKTTLVVASRVSTVSHLDKIIVLNDGCVEAFDTPDNLMKISPTYQKMVHLQQLEREIENY